MKFPGEEGLLAYVPTPERPSDMRYVPTDAPETPDTGGRGSPPMSGWPAAACDTDGCGMSFHAKAVFRVSSQFKMRRCTNAEDAEGYQANFSAYQLGPGGEEVLLEHWLADKKHLADECLAIAGAGYVQVEGHRWLERLEADRGPIQHCFHHIAVSRWTAMTKEEVEEALDIAVD